MGQKRYAFKSWVKRFLIFCLDLIGAVLFFPIKHCEAPAAVKKILAVRIDHLGDVLMTRPALQLLRGLYPGVQIHLMTSPEAARLLKDDPCVDNILTFEKNWFTRGGRFFEIIQGAFRMCRELRAQSYDAAIEFRGDFRTILLLALAGLPFRVGYGITGGGFLLHRSTPYPWSSHQVEANIRLLEVLNPAVSKEDIFVPKLKVSEDRDSYYKKMLREGNPSLPVLVIHPGAGYPSKQWPDEKFAQLAQRLTREKIARIVFIGTADEKKDSRCSLRPEDGIDLRGKTPLEDLPALLAHCDLYLGNDSGPAHLAAAQGVRVLSLFSGTNDADLWRPWGERVTLIQHKVPCSPCEAKICPLAHHDCMRKISVEEVYQTIMEKLNEGKPS